MDETFDDRELLDLLLGDEDAEEPCGREELPCDAGLPPPLSRAQRRLWFLQQMAPESRAYNIFSAVRLSGRLDLAALEAAVGEIVRRHESLRACFPAIDGRPDMRIRKDWRPDIPVEDLSSFAEGARLGQVSRRAAEEARRPFDLAAGPLLRLRLLRLDERDHVAVLALHHIVADGWSMGVFVGELGQLYSAFVQGEPSPLPELPIQYGDFARRQDQWLESDAAEEQRRWWLDRLAGLASLELPTDRPRPAEQSHQGGAHAFRLPNRPAVQLRELGRGEGATPFITLLAAFAVLLHRYTGQDDIVVGSPVANRNRRELESLIGFFVNSLVMRCDLSGDPSFREVLRRVRDFVFEALARQDFPFEDLVKAVAPERDAAGNPLFQVMFSLEDASVGTLELPGLALAPVEAESGVAKFDLLLNMSETAEGLFGAFEYAADLFEADTVRRMAGHFTTLLEAIAAAPDAPVATLPLLSAAEHRQLAEWNDTAAPYPRDESLARLFELQVDQAPEAVAVEFGAERLTYGELNARANRLARRLRECGVAVETPVAVHARRSTGMVAGLLAILKAGGFYVPLDPAYPRHRLERMLDDCRASVLLAERDLLGHLPERQLAVVCLDEDGELAGYADGNPDWPGAGGDNLVYVIYTSGSTGVPKGVAVPQRAVSRLVIGCDYAPLRPDDVIAQVSNASFDAATFEIWGALLNGARLVGVEQDVVLSPLELVAFLRERRITTLFLTTALFNQMIREAPEAFVNLRHLLFGGEQVNPHWVREVLRHGPPERLLHVYGPTENTTFSTWKEVREVPPGAATVPIGRAVSNTRLYVLDAHGQPLPVGVPGELHLAGDGLARGYFGRPELSEERFISDPLNERGGKLYRTGDIVRRLSDGEVEFIGRRDGQVKIRGFRIELGEIEAALVHHPAVREAVVLAREDRPGQRDLVAYLVPGPQGGLVPQQVREDLAGQLPGYMVPATYVVLDALPLNENGKVDRKALPVPAETFERGGGYVPTESPREQCLAAVWREVLGGPEVGLHDNYFERGGDSITAIQVVSRLWRQGWRLRVADMFRHPTIAQLAPCLVEDRQSADEAEGADGAADIPLTAVQRWFFEHYRGERHHFNQAVLLKSAEALDEGRLRRALGELPRRHDALRLRFVGEGDAVRQSRVPAGEPADLAVIDLRAYPAAELQRYADQMQAGLDLERGPLFKAGLFHGTDGDRLLLVIHHLAVDAVSWRILLEELETAYCWDADGVTIEFGPKTCSFRRWAEAMQSFAESPELGAEEDYWARVENAEATPLPTKDDGAARLHGDAETVHAALSPEDTAALLGPAHRAFGTEIMDLLLTALGRALKDWSGGETARITLEGHGREPPDESLDLTRSVGWFTSLYPFLLSVRGDDISGQIRRVKTALREVPRKGFGYGILRYAAGRKARPGSTPQLSFNYLGQFGKGDEKGMFGFSDEATGRAVSPHLSRAHELDIVGLVAGGRLLLSLEFEPRTLARATAATLLDDMARQLGEVLRYCRTLAERGEVAASLPAAWAHLPVEGDIEDVYPLAPLQEGFLFQSLLDPEAGSYFVQVRFHFAGTLDADAFREAWFQLCRRHAVLRSAFVHRGLPRPLQVVLRDRKPEVVFHDFRHLGEAERQACLDAFCLNERRRGFELDREPLLRVAVFREAEGDYHIVWSYHHILIDGWCLSILQRDFVEIYTALLSRRTPRLAAAAAPYRNYINWLGRQDAEAARRFWRHYLEGYEHLATLPKFGSAEAGQPRSLGEEILVLDTDTSARLAHLAARARATLNAVLRSLWGFLLARYNDRDEVVFGAIVSGRPAELAGVEEMIGLFIGAVPVRVAAKPNLLFVDLVRAVQDAALASEARQHLSLADIQKESALGRNLFDHMLIFENYPLRATGSPAGSRARAELTPVEAYDPTHYDLDLSIAPGETITVKFTYDTAVYRPDQMRRTAGHLRTAVESILENPALPLRDISILPSSERRLLLDEFNATKAEYPRERTIHELFEETAAKDPGRIAAVHNGVLIGYGELNARANRIGHRLRRLGVKPNDFVAILDDRGVNVLAAMLGILKAGGAFLPLDPAYPAERIRYMLADSGVRVLISRAARLSELPEGSFSGQSLLLNGDDLAGEPASPLAPVSRATDLAYMLYTSGSTGLPKGAMIRHDGAVNHIYAEFELLGFHAETAFLQSAPSSSDISVWQFLAPVLIGGRTVIADYETVGDPAALLRTIRSEGVTLIELVPAVLKELLDHVGRLPAAERALPRLEWAMVTGEAATPALVNQWLGIYPEVKLVNAYGPTEAADDICQAVLDQPVASDRRAVPIGRPLANLTLYVLDRDLDLVPQGVPGEICVSGIGVGAGYWGNEAMTRASFVPNPYADKGRGEVIYRTGDLGRWLPDGNLEFLGRMDSQVKIRGYRIELGEIEGQLLRAESVEQAVVLARDIGGSKDLAAYVVADARWDLGRVREFLRRSLPDYMVPAFFVRLERFPLTPNGKIDRRALPDPLAAAERTAGSVPPRNATEAALAAIWREVLQIAEIGVLDDFFKLGGHSLKAMQIAGLVHKQFGVELPLRQVFEHPTIAGLADIVAASGKSAWMHIAPAPLQDHYELSYAQRRLWMLHHMDGAAAYNMPEAHLIDVEIDGDVLNRAFRTLVQRHESLRTAFISIDGEPRQQIRAELPFAIAELDLRDSSDPEGQARDIADRDANLPFDLAEPPLLRTSLVRLPGGRSLFVLTMHHIIGDGWSGNLVLRELLSLYDAYLHGRADPLKPLRIQYKDFAAWQNALGFERQERYWVERLSGMPERLSLPYDFAPEVARDFSGGHESLDLRGDVAAGLRELAVRRRTTLANVMLALFELFLFHWTRQNDICVGMSVANRNHPDLENLIGFFVNVLPIRCRLSADMDFDDLLNLVVGHTRDALDQQDYPIDLIVRKLNPSRQANRQPLVNVIYAFQNFADVHVEIRQKGAEPADEARRSDRVIEWAAFDFSFRTSKFDLTLLAIEEADSLRITFEYDSGLFLPATIREQLRTMAEFADMAARLAEAA